MAAENTKTENENQMKVEEISTEETSTPLVASPNEVATAAATEECKDADKESNPPKVVEEGEEPSPQVIEGAQEAQPVPEVVSDQNTCHVDDEGDGWTSLSAATSSTSSSPASESHDSHPLENPPMSDDDDEPVRLMGVNIPRKRERTIKLFGVFITAPCSMPPSPRPPSPRPPSPELEYIGNKKARRF